MSIICVSEESSGVSHDAFSCLCFIDDEFSVSLSFPLLLQFLVLQLLNESVFPLEGNLVWIVFLNRLRYKLG